MTASFPFYNKFDYQLDRNLLIYSAFTVRLNQNKNREQKESLSFHSFYIKVFFKIYINNLIIIIIMPVFNEVFRKMSLNDKTH
jgi:hypothetical protein